MKENGKRNAGKKTAKKIKKPKANRILNPRKVLKDLSALVEVNADNLATAVIEEGMQGQVSPVKFLFEIAHIFPPSDSSTPSEREECLAETLLDALKIPKTPVVHDELQKDEDEVVKETEKEDEKKSEAVTAS